MDVSTIVITSVIAMLAFGLGFAVYFTVGRIKDTLAIAKRLEKIKPERSDPVAVQASIQTAQIINKKARRMDSLMGRYIPTLGSMRTKFRQAGLPISLGIYVAVLLVLASVLTFSIDLVSRPDDSYAIWLGTGRVDTPEAQAQYARAKLIYQIYLFVEPFSAVIIVHFFLSNVVLNMLATRRRNRIVAQMPATLDFIVRSLVIGVPVDAATRDAAADADYPIKEELSRIVQLASIGTPLDRAMRTVADDLDIREFQFFAIATIVQLESGGNLANALANLSDIIRQRHQMRLKVKALAAEGKLSAWFLGAMPLFLFTVFYMTNPEYVAPFFTDQGQVYLMVMAGLMAMGAYVMSRIVRIKI